MAHYTQRVRSYDKARALMTLKGSRNYQAHRGTLAVRLGYVTWLLEQRHPGEGSDQYYAVRHHETDVVSFMAPDIISLNTGGWQTVSTLERLQTFTPSRVSVSGRHMHSRSEAPCIYAVYRGEEYDLSRGEVTLALDEQDIYFE